MSQNFSEGFSTAELLIAIFVGAAFILTGYQLYGIVASNGGNARSQAIASNIAYAALHQAVGEVAPTCGSETLTAATIPPDTSLPGQTAMFVDSSCPYGASSSITKITIYLYYGNNYSKLVEHATLASQ